MVRQPRSRQRGHWDTASRPCQRGMKVLPGAPAAGVGHHHPSAFSTAWRLPALCADKSHSRHGCGRADRSPATALGPQNRESRVCYGQRRTKKKGVSCSPGRSGKPIPPSRAPRQSVQAHGYRPGPRGLWTPHSQPSPGGFQRHSLANFSKNLQAMFMAL